MSFEFHQFCTYASRIEDLSADTAIIEQVAAVLADAEDDLRVTARFIQGEIFPAYDERKTSVGPALMRQGLATAAGVDEDTVKDQLAEVGDLGEVCSNLDLSADAGQQTLVHQSLTVGEVYQTMSEIAETSGSGSQQRKKDMVKDVLHRASSLEAKYFTRLLLNEMRIGVGQGTVRDGIAQAFDVQTENVQRAIMVTNDIGEVAVTARDDGDEGLTDAEMAVGVPVEPMLAKKTTLETAIEDGGDEQGEVAVEVKYDGSRLQLHKDGDDVTLYTRGLEDVTAALPEVVETVRDSVSAEAAILDAEVVAYDPDDPETPLPFNEVTKRVNRKHDIEETREDIMVDIHVFDLLYANGETYIDDSLRNRYDALTTVCEELVAQQWLVESAEEIAVKQTEAIESGNEGVMVKNPAETYKPGNRGKRWLKLKAQPETIDCVVVGGEWGEGRRAGFIGTFMLAVHDEGDDELKTIGKVATGITDDDLADLTDRFEPLIETEAGQEVTFKPEVVFEVGFEELQPSPEYTSGYGLRFPRFVRVRDEKRVEDADSLSRVLDIADDA